MSNSPVPDVIGEYPVGGLLRVGAAEVILAEVRHVEESRAEPSREALSADLKSLGLAMEVETQFVVTVFGDDKSVILVHLYGQIFSTFGSVVVY